MNPYLYTDPDDETSLPETVLPKGGMWYHTLNSLSQYNFRATGQYGKTFNNTHITNFFGGVEINSVTRHEEYFQAWGVVYDNGRLPYINPDLFKQMNEEERKAEVFLKPEDISLAIGKNGNNIKLATMLTGYTIDVFRNDAEIDEEDIYIEEFNDEIDSWIIDVLKGIGCDTAKSVLNIPREELIRRTDLEEETVDEVLRILKSEFEQ